MFVRSAWNRSNDDFDGLELPLDTLASQLDVLAQQHNAYPVLHYYHSERRRVSSAVAVAISTRR